ncbi:phosphotransferase [Catenulispora sp. NL8]|uniref:Phosphotransferase n=1 Tax=Catenulispora pinistramenti TaxID=2705254 RepID=A0ABS5KRA0_9ACTN|nr:phosphotransferase [Catenulispora pinistramenti]MBS2548573.1 phosphotransferase [Catenulispora pinistramenti]
MSMPATAPGTDRNMIPTVEQALVRLRADSGWPPNARDLAWWIPDSARRQRQRLFVSCLASDGAALVAKVPLDAADTMVDREREILRGPAPAGVRRPTLVHDLERGFVMTWVPDRDFPEALTAVESADDLRKLLEQAVDAMLPLHTGGAAGLGDGRAVAHGYLGDLIETAGDAALEALTPTWIGPMHGDLGPWNIRWNSADGRLSLIDWEDYQQTGLPVVDLLNTVLTSALLIYPDYRTRGHDWLGEQILHSDGPFRSAARSALRRYAHATGQSAVSAARLLPIACLWLHRRVEKQGRLTGHLFYLPLMRAFQRAEPRWIGELDD